MHDEPLSFRFCRTLIATFGAENRASCATKSTFLSQHKLWFYKWRNTFRAARFV